MNKKIFKRIQLLRKDGVSLEVAITLVISLSKSPSEAANTIVTLLNEEAAMSYKENKI